jgi:chaperonin GroES
MGRVPNAQAFRHPRRRSASFTQIMQKHYAPLEREVIDVANIKPLEDKIVVQASEAETTTASGIVIPDTAKEKPQEGKVLAVGPGRIDDNGNRVPLDVAVGDVVIYSKYGGTEVKYNGEEYLILSARDVLAVVN